jgi:hypothetical protein
MIDPGCPAADGKEWRCRRCQWHGCTAEGRHQSHWGDRSYVAPLCPNCGSYFNDQDFAVAGIVLERTAGER